MTAMITESDSLNVWGGGQLMAFSGLDGPTDFDFGLTARTSFDATGLDIKLPDEARLVFSGERPTQAILAGDFFDLQVSGQRTRGAFLDAHHLLIGGPLTMLVRPNATAGIGSCLQKQSTGAAHPDRSPPTRPPPSRSTRPRPPFGHCLAAPATSYSRAR